MMRLRRTPGERSARWKWALWASALFCAGLAMSYGLQPDWLTPVTLLPAWCWLVPGLALAGIGFRRQHKLPCLAAFLLWVAYAVLFVEEVRSVTRVQRPRTAEWQGAHERGRAVRVVSLNCYAGSARAAAEVAAYEPDIVLLQESPGRENLERLAGDLFGADGVSLWGGDTAILVRGRLTPHHVDGLSHFVHVSVELTSGFKAHVVSIRLSPPVTRLDFWSPAFWRDHRDNRVKHRRQIEDVVAEIEELPRSNPLIVGGDFNTPPNDGALSLLQLRLVDTFRQAGCGWGGTSIRGFPWFRIDQVWAGGGLRAQSVFTQRTVHSDHRMVVCDLMLDSLMEPEDDD
jgi:vancomycin resistance protein VanJ